MSQAKREKHAPDEHGLSLTCACWHPGTLPLETVVGTELPCREMSQRCLLSLERSDSVHWPAQAALPIPTSHPCCQPLCLPRQESGCSPPELRAALRPGAPTQHPKDIPLGQALQDGHGVCLELHQRLALTWAPNLRLPSALLCVGGIWECSGHSATAGPAHVPPDTAPAPHLSSPSALNPSPSASPLLNNPSPRLNPP